MSNAKIPSAEKSTSNLYLDSLRAWEFVIPSSLDIAHSSFVSGHPVLPFTRKASIITKPPG